MSAPNSQIHATGLIDNLRWQADHLNDWATTKSLLREAADVLEKYALSETRQPAPSASCVGATPVAWAYRREGAAEIITRQPPDRVDFKHYKREEYTIQPLYAATPKENDRG